MARNALFLGNEKFDEHSIPRCTYTDPEIAAIGPSEAQLRKDGIEFDVYCKNFEHNDRAICESQKGLYKVLTTKGGDKILGATLVGGPAGDLIGLVSTAMHNKIGIQKLGAAIYPYPTYAEIFR